MTTDKQETSDLNIISTLNKVIHEPARLLIISYLYISESADFIFLKGQTGLTWGNLSAHMMKLEKEGYVTITKEIKGKKTYTFAKLTKEGIQAYEEYRKKMKTLFG